MRGWCGTERSAGLGPERLDAWPVSATVAGVGRERWRLAVAKLSIFGRDETPRGERESGAALWPHLTGHLGGRVASGIDARQGRDAVRGSTRSAKARPEAIAQGDANRVPRSSE